MSESTYTEHEKLKAISEKSQAVYDFLEWVYEEKGAVLAVDDLNRDYSLIPLMESKQRLLAEFFGIDLNRLEDEKLAMLEECRLLASPPSEEASDE